MINLDEQETKYLKSLTNKLTSVGSVCTCVNCGKVCIKNGDSLTYCDIVCKNQFEESLYTKSELALVKLQVDQHNINKVTAVGKDINCACCFRLINKTANNKQFCNSKCRNNYHNTTNVNRKIKVGLLKLVSDLFTET